MTGRGWRPWTRNWSHTHHMQARLTGPRECRRHQSHADVALHRRSSCALRARLTGPQECGRHQSHEDVALHRRSPCALRAHLIDVPSSSSDLTMCSTRPMASWSLHRLVLRIGTPNQPRRLNLGRNTGSRAAQACCHGSTYGRCKIESRHFVWGLGSQPYSCACL